MHTSLTGFAAIAVLVFGLAFALLMLFMAVVQPIWSVIDCAVDNKRSTLDKVLWLLALIFLWGVANWFYGAFAAANGMLMRLTRLAWALALSLIIAFLVLFGLNADFRRGVDKEWRDRGSGIVVEAAPVTTQREDAEVPFRRIHARRVSSSVPSSSGKDSHSQHRDRHLGLRARIYRDLFTTPAMHALCLDSRLVTCFAAA